MLTICGVKDVQSCSEVADNGQQALDVIRSDVEQNNQLCSRFGLILMDYQMPFMDGNTATSKIREYLYSCNVDQPIIVGCTGHVEESYVQRSI